MDRVQIDLLNQIEEATGRNDKIELLKTANAATQKVFKYALDTYTTFGTTANTLTYQEPRPDEVGAVWDKTWWDAWFTILDQLAARSLTGHAAQQAVREHMKRAPFEDHFKWALRVLHKDLRCGVSIKTITSVFPKLIKPFAVMLANTFDSGSPPSPTAPGYFEPKLDGLRMTVVAGVPYTRNGNRIYNVGHIVKELQNQFLKQKADINNYVLDGECVGTGSFEETIGSARTHGDAPSDLVYHIFDMILIEEWNAKKTEAFCARRNRLENMLRTRKCVKVIDSVPVMGCSVESAKTFLEAYTKAGYEGAMWKNANAPYEWKRSNDVLKIKSFDTEDGEIIAYENGTGRNANVLGCFTVRLDSGTEVRVGSGYTDHERKDFWQRRKSMIGRMIEIQYQNKTAKGSLRFPVFVRLRPDKD